MKYTGRRANDSTVHGQAQPRLCRAATRRSRRSSRRASASTPVRIWEGPLKRPSLLQFTPSVIPGTRRERKYIGKGKEGEDLTQYTDHGLMPIVTNVTVWDSPGRLSALSVSHSESSLYGTFVWACRALYGSSSQRWWFLARAGGRPCAVRHGVVPRGLRGRRPHGCVSP
jgi:hypothetical protein